MEGAITALKEKKTWYSQQPRPPRKTAEERAAELAEKEKAREEGKEGKEGGAKAEGGKPKKEKKQPKEFKSCESRGGWFGLVVCVCAALSFGWLVLLDPLTDTPIVPLQNPPQPRTTSPPWPKAAAATELTDALFVSRRAW